MGKALKNIPSVDKEKLSTLYDVGIKDVPEKDKGQKTDEERLSLFYGKKQYRKTKPKPPKTKEQYILKTIKLSTNYYKMDNSVSDFLVPLQTLAEQVVYNRLYRLSIGYQKNICRVGMGAIAKSINIRSSQKTIKKAIAGLIKKGHIRKFDTSKKGTLYQVFLPFEIKGVVKNTIVNSTIVKNTIVNSTTSTVVKNTTGCSKKYYSQPNFTDDKKNPKDNLKTIYKDIIKDDDEILKFFKEKTNIDIPKGVAKDLIKNYGRTLVLKHIFRLNWTGNIKNPVGVLIDSLKDPDKYLSLEEESREEKKQNEIFLKQKEEEKRQNELAESKREQREWQEQSDKFDALPKSKQALYIEDAKKQLVEENPEIQKETMEKTILRDYNIKIRAIQIMVRNCSQNLSI